MGLAGSSAIVTATFRALLRFYGVTLDMLQLPRDQVRPPVLPLSPSAPDDLTEGSKRVQVPNLILAIEREELGIVAGLQDRVIQEYDGLVYMDFARAILDSNNGAGHYESLDPDRTRRAPRPAAVPCSGDRR